METSGGIPNYLQRARVAVANAGAGAGSDGEQVPLAPLEQAVPSAATEEPTGAKSGKSAKSPLVSEANCAGVAAPDALVMARLRAGLSVGLQRWSDDDLVALAQWPLVIAFSRGQGRDWRRYLPPSLAALSDEDLMTLVDWPSLATLESNLWARDAETAGQVSRGAVALAAWWSAHRGRAKPE